MAVKKGKSPKRRPGKKRPGGQQLKILLAALFLLAFLVTTLVLLSQVRRSFLPPSSPPPPVATIEAGPPIEDIRVEVESSLLRSGISLAHLQEHTSHHGVRNYEVEGKLPSTDILETLGRRLEERSPELRLQVEPETSQMRILWRGEVCFYLFFHPPAPTAPETAPKVSKGRPRLAIIIDDMGRDTGTVKKLLAIGLPVTISVLPNEPESVKVATLAHEGGREVLIHIPMEPEGYPTANPGPDALFLNLSPEEILSRFRTYRERVPFAVGGNNHMGSRFTENREAMDTVLKAMKESGLFFVDSLTSARSVGFEEARRKGVATAVRDLFLDNVQEVDKITREIHRLVKIADQRGHAIGICHPHPQTIEALRRVAPFLRGAGIEMVPVSKLLTPSRTASVGPGGHLQ
jgi:polysaccharide deacetylase 2 family uncharacterized protein YibQ